MDKIFKESLTAKDSRKLIQFIERKRKDVVGNWSEQDLHTKLLQEAVCCKRQKLLAELGT